MTRDASNFTPVILESPFAGGEPGRHFLYWQQANRHAIFAHHEAPRSSHFYYTQFLNDAVPEERAVGISLGYASWDQCAKIVFYMDLGMSKGMGFAWKRAEKIGKPREKRWLGLGWENLTWGIAPQGE